MKKGLHPTYHQNAKVTCACGNSFIVGSTKEKLEQLKAELATHFNANPSFGKARTMGQLVKRQLKQTLQNNLLLIPKSKSRFAD